MREASIERKTRETQIEAALRIGCARGYLEGSSNIGFFDHMLNSFCVHGGFILSLKMTGDTEVDGHHTVEDCGITIGMLFAKLLGDKSGIKRFGSSYVPMDESLAFCAVDISGRPYLVFDSPVSSQMIGGYDAQLTREFFRALAFNMGCTLHIKLLYGDNEHHKVEAIFKSAARAISEAATQTDGGILSAKGTLS